MSAVLEVLDGGDGTTVQDLGRRGRRHWGVALSGALDPWWARAAHALLDNPPEAALLELRLLGPRLRLERTAVRVAVVGDVAATVERAAGVVQPLPGWCSVTLQPGDTLRLGAVRGLAYVAVAGGIDVPPVLGSRATHERTTMGGLQGRMLRTGDRLPCVAAHAEPGVERRADPLPDDDGPIRVLWGPQDDHFTQAARALLLQADWRLTSERDRMGMRLAGPPLEHLSPGHADIVSDGVAPGAIQVPASGQPIVLLADAQTVGGYPKLATVIQADLGRLARWPSDRSLHFAAVTLEQARAALHARRAAWVAWAARRQTWRPPGYVDEARLYGANLISGVLRAAMDDAPWVGLEDG
ncbi:MAG: biotin-dependent carboxyltransferase family protein [Tepidimonas taiwanensis]|nr:biotin-dependent carboxyltransferase family protein [Tepidimonas taiwanensis]